MLQALALHNIPAHTEISYPDLFDDKSVENAPLQYLGQTQPK
ncbi:hypothetical protein COO91_08045 [Nostoc flagelliforme CCNUN1]|uniref:Uncharacterized protein n=1 Tax=Nostoc flagelliforme CCNUN1 TaxID=2038116 RepID=A0A2K8T2L3_9NOSO|nr:hypothetical protein COO91_08045 [Nostoc flagelliforme CCNUN1]